MSGRGVGGVLGMNKSNVYIWIKKRMRLWIACLQVLSWMSCTGFVERKPRTETRENVYLMTMVSREPGLIVGFDVAYDNHLRESNELWTVRRQQRSIAAMLGVVI